MLHFVGVRFAVCGAFDCRTEQLWNGRTLNYCDLMNARGMSRRLQQLVERHSGWIFAAARRRLGDDHLADDATQAVFVVLASKGRQLLETRSGSLSAWLFHVMHFTCARLRRTQKRAAEIEGLAGPARMWDEGGSLFEDDGLVLLLEESVAQLPAVEREIVVRRYYRAKVLGRSGMR